MEASMLRNRPRGILVIALLMVVLGLAEMTTGVTRNFFGIAAGRSPAAKAAALTLGALYALAGVLLLPMKRGPAAVALALLVAIVAGRVAMVATGLFPIHSLRQVVAIAAGTSIVALFALYIAWRWPEFR
jgi:hypothetical protein